MTNLLLDKSALLVYAALEARTVAVAELMLMVEESNGIVGVASTAWLEAYREAPTSDERRRLRRLVGRPEHVVRMTPLRVDDVMPVAKLWPSLDNGNAHTVLDAIRFDASIASCEPGVFAGLIDDSNVFEV